MFEKFFHLSKNFSSSNGLDSRSKRYRRSKKFPRTPILPLTLFPLPAQHKPLKGYSQNSNIGVVFICFEFKKHNFKIVQSHYPC